MIGIIKRIVSGPEAVKTPTEESIVEDRKHIPVVHESAILAKNKDLLTRIQLSSDFTADQFKYHVMPLIQNYARLVHLLPATNHVHHYALGGLFRLGLEVGFYSLQSSEGIVFVSSGAHEERLKKEPRWRYASFLAGMAYNTSRLATNIVVSSPDGKTRWDPYLDTIAEWAKRSKITHYQASCQDGVIRANQSAALLFLNRLITPSCLSYLAEADREMIPIVVNAIAGVATPGIKSPLSSLIVDTLHKCEKKNVLDGVNKNDTSSRDSFIHNGMLYVLHELIARKWSVNTPGAELWVTTAGVYVDWSIAAPGYCRSINERVSLPPDQELIANILTEKKLALPYVRDSGEMSHLWPVEIELSDAIIRIEGVRLADSQHSAFAKLKPLRAKLLNVRTSHQNGVGRDESRTHPTIIPVHNAAVSSRQNEKEAVARITESAPMIDTTEFLLEPTPNQPPAAPETKGEEVGVSDWLAGSGQAGAVLTQFIQFARGNSKTEGKDYYIGGDVVAISFPAGFEGMGKSPDAILQILSDQQWLQRDPEKPGRRVISYSTPHGPKQNCVLLKSHIARAFIDELVKVKNAASK